VEFSEFWESFNLNLVKEYPKLNDRIIKQFAKSIEEKRQILEDLGLTEIENLPIEGLGSYLKKIISFSPNAFSISDFEDTNLNRIQLSNIKDDGYYNKAVLILGTMPLFNRGLLKELKKLSSMNDYKQNNLSKSGLSSLFVTKRYNNEKTDLLQITKINTSQKSSLEKAFTQDFSIITGPPGTGKSQVVVNILANAFEKKQSVLFTSKNNKAVDVVCAKLFNILKFPINLRLGSKTNDRNYTREFLDLLDRILGGTNNEQIYLDYQRKKEKYFYLKKEYSDFSTKLAILLKFRNTINELDLKIENFERDFQNENSLIAKVKNLNYLETDLVQKIAIEINSIKNGTQTIFKRGIGAFSRTYPYKNLYNLLKEINSSLDNIISIDSKIPIDIIYYEKQFEKLEKIYEYINNRHKLTELRIQLNLEDINELSNKLNNIEDKFIESSIEYLESLGKYRMNNLSNEERAILTNYSAVLKELYDDYSGKSAYAQLKTKQENLFKEVVKILPVWSITNLSVSSNLPFIEGIFDLIVIDEASQSDIPSSIPVLYRGKNAVIIGDPWQLQHVSGLNGEQNKRLLEKYNLIESGEGIRFSYINQSLYKCARGIVDQKNVTLLNEHYRSHHSIIDFSNNEWYNGELDIRTNYDSLFKFDEIEDNIIWIDIKGKTEKLNGTSALNKEEAERICVTLERLFKRKNNKSVGIVTPFSAQEKYLKSIIIKKFGEEIIRKNLLFDMTIHKFQGDERDIIIFSPVISNGVDQNTTIKFLRNTGNLFNVAITRARSILFIVGDKDVCLNSGVPYLKKFVEYIDHKKYNKSTLPRDKFQSIWEEHLFDVLQKEGLNPIRQHQIGPYFVNLAVETNDKRLAIEVDGEWWHGVLSSSRLERDLFRDENIRKMGWMVQRFWMHSLKYDLESCVNQIKNILNDKS
jgi:superfamily I DNA and/or RNA helicase